MDRCLMIGSMPGFEKQNRVYGVGGAAQHLPQGITKMLSRYLSKQKTAKGIIVLGQMNNYDKTFEMENRVYSRYGIAPTIRTYGGVTCSLRFW